MFNESTKECIKALERRSQVTGVVGDHIHEVLIGDVLAPRFFSSTNTCGV